MKSRKDNSKTENRIIRDIDIGNRRPIFKHRRPVVNVVRRDDNGEMVEERRCTLKK